MLIKFLIIAAFILSFVVPFGGFLLSKKEQGNFKISLACNIFFFSATFIIANILVFSGSVSAAEVANTASNTVASNSEGLKYIAAALSTGLATIGAGIAVASSASSALGAISEDSSIMGKSLIFVALAEGIAIYGLLISVMILNK